MAKECRICDRTNEEAEMVLFVVVPLRDDKAIISFALCDEHTFEVFKYINRQSAETSSE